MASARDFEAQPYTADERRVATFLAELARQRNELGAMARALVAPFEDVGADFLTEIASDKPGDLHIVSGRSLTAHFAKAIVSARAATATPEGR